MMVAMERREAIKVFALSKFSSFCSQNDDEKLLDVVAAVFAVEAQSQNFFSHL